MNGNVLRSANDDDDDWELVTTIPSETICVMGQAVITRPLSVHVVGESVKK